MSINKKYINTLGKVIFTGLLFTNLVSAQTCVEKVNLGNKNKTNVLKAFNSEFKGFNKKFGIGKFEVKDATAARFTNCEGRLKVNIKISRLWRSNAEGFAKLKGHIKSIDKNLVCLTNIKIYSLDLKHTYNWEKQVYMTMANPFLGKLARCYKYKN